MLIVSRESRRDTYFLLMVKEQGRDGRDSGGVMQHGDRIARERS